jgi:hypothetical protein
MRTMQIRVPTKVKEGVREALSLSSEQRSQVIAILKEFHGNQLPSISAVAERVADEVGIGLEMSQNIFQSLASFNRALFEFKFSLSEMVSLVQESEQGSFLETEFLEEMLSTWFVSTLTKLEALRSEYDAIYRGGKLITDVRHVFPEEPGQKPEAATIVHLLRIRYQQDRIKDFYVAMDMDDLEELRGQIDRAVQKEASLRTLAAESKIPCYGEK